MKIAKWNTVEILLLLFICIFVIAMTSTRRNLA